MFVGIVDFEKKRAVHEESLVTLTPWVKNWHRADPQRGPFINVAFFNSGTSQQTYHEKRYQLCGEIFLYNRAELHAALELAPRGQDDYSDETLVLLGYEKWGVQLPEHLIGDFAFVIWDELKNQIFVARDHLGTKRFYYHYDNSKNRLEF